MKAGIAGLLSFILTAGLGPLLLPLLRRWKFGQSIREEGPSWHQKKSGTPTVGGVLFIPSILLFALLLDPSAEMVVLCVSAFLFGIIGFLDDAIKIIKKHNQGLSSRQKFALQVLAAAVLVVWSVYGLGIDTAIVLPFGRSLILPLWGFIPFSLVLTVGMVNAVNLTDGIDGLASSVSLVVAVFFGVLCFRLGYDAGGTFAGTVAGGCAGFLVYNFHPAKVFMGDTGSLFLGGAFSALGVVYGLEFFWVVSGVVFIVETLSVVIQVASFKLTGKRVFKMSPIHHHFELCGWSEWKIVSIFSAVTLVLCTLLLLLL